MGPGAGVDQERVHAVGMRLVDALAHRALMVGLKGLDLGAEFPAQRRHAGIDFVQRDRAALPEVALAEHVEVDAVQQENFHESAMMK